jgi:FtsP/CotA-like multicopper oxidase with cupredoxin domain
VRPSLTPFVDALPLPRRILADQHGGELTVAIRAATHRFHRDLSGSWVWAYDGRVPGPTIEAERCRPVRVHWRNQIDQPYPVASTLAWDCMHRQAIRTEGVHFVVPDHRTHTSAAFGNDEIPV